MTTFSLTDKQKAKLTEWYGQQRKKITDAGGSTYSGAIGGDLVYSFTPTSVGVALTVRYHLTGEKINLTEYEDW